MLFLRLDFCSIHYMEVYILLCCKLINQHSWCMHCLLDFCKGLAWFSPASICTVLCACFLLSMNYLYVWLAFICHTELSGGCVGVVPRRKFFWSIALCGFLEAYNQATMQVIRFLQEMYGFVFWDYNYDCMIAYIDSTHSACRCSMCLVFYVLCHLLSYYVLRGN
jgi:hypothetical protein